MTNKWFLVNLDWMGIDQVTGNENAVVDFLYEPPALKPLGVPRETFNKDCAPRQVTRLSPHAS